MFIINIKEISGIYLFIFDKGNTLPKLLIQGSCKRFHKRIILLPEHLFFTFFYNFLAAVMRALGDSKSALYFLMISSVLNIFGDLFFVQVLGWGSEGCALSTVLS